MVMVYTLLAVERALTDDYGFRNPPTAAFVDDGLGELTGVVLRPVQGSVPAALHSDQSAVGAGDEARAVVRIRVVARLFHAARVVCRVKHVEAERQFLHHFSRTSKHRYFRDTPQNKTKQSKNNSSSTSSSRSSSTSNKNSNNSNTVTAPRNNPAATTSNGDKTVMLLFCSIVIRGPFLAPLPPSTPASPSITGLERRWLPIETLAA